ncbi:hypothetical protein BH24ACT5_BH24ACT5_24390 [soil metagenome]
MAESAHLSVGDVYRAYIDAENARDHDTVQALLHSEITVEVNGVAQLADREGDARATAVLLAHYPDYQRVLHEVLVDGDRLAARWTMSGTSSAIPAGAPLEVHGCTIATVIDGQITAAALYTSNDVLDRMLADS